jgi:transcription termination/antitermination protein NusG
MATRKTKTATLDREEETAGAASNLAVAAGAEVADENAELSPAAEGRQWYVIHTYSGYENKVKANLEHRVETMDARGLILQVVIPTEDEIEIRDGQRRTVSKKIFPGYVLVQMIELKEGDEASNKAWYVVRNTPGVTGFVGSGPRPVPLEDNEVKQILRQMRVEEPRIKVGFQVGQSVRIIDGPFIDFAGQVSDINLEKGKVKVLVSFFGRETPVELDFLEVERL